MNALHPTLTNLWQLLEELLDPTALGGVLLLALCLLAAGTLVRLLRPRHDDGATPAAGAHGADVPHEGGIWFGQRGLDGLLFPLLALGLAYGVQRLLPVLAPGLINAAVFRLALPLLVSLTVIRGVARVLHAAFPHLRAVRVLERSVSWLVWGGMVLWITDLLGPTLEALDQVHWKVAGASVSLRSLLEGALTAVVTLLLVLWLSASLEARLMRAEGVNLSVRKIAANAVRALLLLVGLLLALSMAGIPLGALSVFGGAIGVGLGFGLQKLASNYVSGFVILAEQSLRIGDVVKVDGFEGRITDISTRYTVIRAISGRESIVPNELLITQRVENCSLADPKVLLTTQVDVAYGTDLERLTPLLRDAIGAVDRVLADPGPSVMLWTFGANGLQLLCAYWIADLERGEGGVRDGVNRAILRVLNAQGVEIPYPQQVVRVAPGAELPLPVAHSADGRGA